MLRYNTSGIDTQRRFVYVGTMKTKGLQDMLVRNPVHATVSVTNNTSSAASISASSINSAVLSSVRLPSIDTNATIFNGTPIRVTLRGGGSGKTRYGYGVMARLAEATISRTPLTRSVAESYIKMLQKAIGIKLDIGKRYSQSTTALILLEDISDYAWLLYLAANVDVYLKFLEDNPDVASISFTTTYPSRSKG